MTEEWQKRVAFVHCNLMDIIPGSEEKLYNLLIRVFCFIVAKNLLTFKLFILALVLKYSIISVYVSKSQTLFVKGLEY